MWWYTLLRESISILNIFRECYHGFRLCICWLIVTNESNLNESMIVTAPLVCCCDTSLISRIRYLSILFNHIVIADMIDTKLSFVSSFDCCKSTSFRICVVELNSFNLRSLTPSSHSSERLLSSARICVVCSKVPWIGRGDRSNNYWPCTKFFLNLFININEWLGIFL